MRAGEAPDGADWGREPPEAWGRLGVEGETRPVETERGDWPAFYRGVAAALRDGSPPPVTAAEAIAVLDVLEQGFVQP